MNNTIKAFAAACFMSTTNAVEYPGDNCCTFWDYWNFRPSEKTRLKLVCNCSLQGFENLDPGMLVVKS